jgi:hypothetical protein
VLFCAHKKLKRKAEAINASMPTIIVGTGMALKDKDQAFRSKKTINFF